MRSSFTTAAAPPDASCRRSSSIIAPGGFTVSDGNHRLEALRRAGRATCLVIVWTTGAADAEAFRRWLREERGA